MQQHGVTGAVTTVSRASGPDSIQVMKSLSGHKVKSWKMLDSNAIIITLPLASRGYEILIAVEPVKGRGPGQIRARVTVPYTEFPMQHSRYFERRRECVTSEIAVLYHTPTVA